jgi:hypothetical protein
MLDAIEPLIQGIATRAIGQYEALAIVKFATKVVD